jgi:ATP-dependent DNA helicase RecG
VIEQAERFGLAQLHQLRGRIGRGEKSATLVALAQAPLSDMARQRLNLLAATTDGFKIAEADLELRGPGEVFGMRQSGLPELRVARLSSDRDLIEGSRAVLQKLHDMGDQLDKPYHGLHSYLKERTGPLRRNLGGG